MTTAPARMIGRALLADHDRRRRGVAADERRHDRRVDDPKAVEPVDPQLRVDDGQRRSPILQEPTGW